MSDFAEAWLENGVGTPPQVRWSFSTESRLTQLDVAWEADEVVAADDSGGVYRLDPNGRLRHVVRGLTKVGRVAFADAGSGLAAAYDDKKVALLDESLAVIWSLTLYDKIVGLALDPFGKHLAVALANRDVRIYTATRRPIAEFEVVRPARFLKFAATEPLLIGAAEDGLLAAWQLSGKPVWDVRLFASCGDLAMSGDAATILLAGFAHGIQRFDKAGTNRGAFVVEGTPARIATSYDGSRIAAATIERQLYFLDRGGDLRWAAATPDDVVALACDAAGRSIVVGFASGLVTRLGW
jgi:hypothetical protein